MKRRKVRHIGYLDDVISGSTKGHQVKMLCGANIWPMRDLDLPTCSECVDLLLKEHKAALLHRQPAFTWTLTGTTKSVSA